MKTITKAETIKTLTTHYVDGAFVESHGREVLDIIRPTDGQVIARVTLGDEEDTRRAITAATSAFATYGRTTGRTAKILRRRTSCFAPDDLTPRWSRNTECRPVHRAIGSGRQRVPGVREGIQSFL